MSFSGLAANSTGLSSTLAGILPTYPFTVGYWALNTSTTGANVAWSVGNTANTTIYWILGTPGTGSAHGIGSGAAVTLLANVQTVGQWWFFIGRFISATNRRLTALEPDLHAIENVQNTTSNTPSGFTNTSWGFIRESTPASIWNGHLAECWRTNTDIQPDGAALNNDLLFQLAYKGPWSVSSVAQNIIEYHSFLQAWDQTHDTIDDPTSDVFGRTAAAWTTNGTPTLGPHPPLASDYVYLNTIESNRYAV